MLLHTGEKVLT